VDSVIIIATVHAAVFELCAPLPDMQHSYYAIILHPSQLALHLDGVKHVLPIKTELHHKILGETVSQCDGHFISTYPMNSI
jgi:hypothetical protein